MNAVLSKQQPYRRVGLLCVCLVAVAGVCAMWLWRAPAVQVLSVQSGSMQPLIQKGDAVIIEPVHSTDLRIGDIISYHNPSDERVTITHRIQRIDSQSGLITTKGDNAPRADEPFSSDLVAGRVQQRVPRLGYGIDLLHSVAGLVAVIYIPALVVVGLELRRLTLFFQPTYVLHNYH